VSGGLWGTPGFHHPKAHSKLLAVDESAKILWVQWMPRLDKMYEIGHISSNIRDI